MPNHPSPHEPELIRTLADLDAWVEEETPSLSTLAEWQASKGELSPQVLEAIPKVLFGRGAQRDSHVLAAVRLLRTYSPPLRRPILEGGKRALRKSLAKSKSEIAASLRARDELRPLEQIEQDNEIYPHRPFGPVDDLAVLTAFFAAIAEGLREQHFVRVWFPPSVRAQSDCDWRNYKEPFTPVEFTEAPYGIYRVFYLPRIRHWYADTLLPGYRMFLEESRQKRDAKRWLVPFPDSAVADPHTDVEAEVIERVGTQQGSQAILKLLNPNEVAWLERYAAGQERGLSDQEFAHEEGVSFPAFRKRKQRIRDRIEEISKTMSQTDGNLGLLDRGETERNESDVSTALIEELRQDRAERRQNEALILAGIHDIFLALWGRPPAVEAEEILAELGDAGIGGREDTA